MEKKLFKTLIFKGDRTKVLGEFAVIMELGKGNPEVGGCNIPRLMTIETTIRDLETMYPNIDFRKLQLIVLVTHPIRTNSA